MKKMAIGFAAMAALIGVPVIASAQSTEAQSTDDILRRLQALEASNAALAKENATLRLENTKLRGRVSEQKGSNETVTAQQTSTTSASTLNRTSSKVALYDKASMVVKAPPPAPVPVYSWTGFYAGGNIGYSWGNANTDVVGNGTQDSLNLAGFGPMFISIPLTLLLQIPPGQTASSAAVRSVTIISSVRTGCWALRPISKAQVNAEAVNLPIRSLSQFAEHYPAPALVLQDSWSPRVLLPR